MLSAREHNALEGVRAWLRRTGASAYTGILFLAKMSIGVSRDVIAPLISGVSSLRCNQIGTSSVAHSYSWQRATAQPPCTSRPHSFGRVVIIVLAPCSIPHVRFVHEVDTRVYPLAGRLATYHPILPRLFQLSKSRPPAITRLDLGASRTIQYRDNLTQHSSSIKLCAYAAVCLN